MTLLGKLLIIFNLLAAGGFVYLATQDWKGRQSITAAGLRYKLYLSGLPFEGPDKFDAEDETPFIVTMAGGYPTETVSKKILEIYFQSASGGPELGDKAPVPCQLAEIKRVKGKISAQLKDAAPPQKVELLKGWLIEQCENYEQRLSLMALVDAGNADELEKRLMGLFDTVLEPSKPLGAEVAARADEGADEKALTQKVEQGSESRIKPIDPFERQTRAAQLLAFLNPSPEWQKHVMIVVGLRRYVAAIAVQSFRYKDMSARIEKLIVADQAGHLAEVANLAQLAITRTDLANRAAKLRQAKTEEKKKEDDFIATRETQLKKIQDQLQKVKAEVDELLAKQSNTEAELFEVQREVAVTLEEVYQLEVQLTAREKELLNAKP